MSDIKDLLANAVDDARHGWSVGIFGAIGEFIRDPDEAVHRRSGDGVLEIASDRGAMRLKPRQDVKVIAYDTLGSDGETWGQSVAFCLPKPENIEQAWCAGSARTATRSSRKTVTPSCSTSASARAMCGCACAPATPP